jgi:hypothetical protein
MWFTVRRVWVIYKRMTPRAQIARSSSAAPNLTAHALRGQRSDRWLGAFCRALLPRLQGTTPLFVEKIAQPKCCLDDEPNSQLQLGSAGAKTILGCSRYRTHRSACTLNRSRTCAPLFRTPGFPSSRRYALGLCPTQSSHFSLGYVRVVD